MTVRVGWKTTDADDAFVGSFLATRAAGFFKAASINEFTATKLRQCIRHVSQLDMGGYADDDSVHEMWAHPYDT